MLPAHTHVAKFTNPHFTGLWREHPAEGRTLAAEARPPPVAFPVTVPQRPTLLSALGIRARKHCSHPAPDFCGHLTTLAHGVAQRSVALLHAEQRSLT